MPDPGRGQAQPAALGIAAQQHLGDRDTDQLGISQHRRPAPPGQWLPQGQDVVVQVDVECGHKGVQVCFHTPTMGALPHARTRFSNFPSTI
ncbi:hypothetical protein GCM10009678_73960 [Actinomadura kijaniata]